jgi:uncharacterized protein
MTGPEMPSETSGRLKIGLWLTAGAATGLAVFTDLAFRESLALPFFLVFLPAVAVAQLPVLRRELPDRMTVYLGSGTTILVLGAAALLLGAWSVGPRELGLVALPPGSLLAWTAGITAAVLAVTFVFRPVERWVAGGPPAFLRHLLPRTSPERAAFVGLSFAAGWGEELVYRGYVLVALVLLGMGVWPALALSSLAFGFLHAYQGRVGVARTGVMGFLLGVPVVVTGSLLPSMAAHALVDLIAGLVLGPYLLGTDDEPGHTDETETPAPRDP